MERDFDVRFVNGNGGCRLAARPCLGPELLQLEIDCSARLSVFGCRDDDLPSDRVELGIDVVLQSDDDLRSSDVEGPLQPFKNAHRILLFVLSR